MKNQKTKQMENPELKMYHSCGWVGYAKSQEDMDRKVALNENNFCGESELSDTSEERKTINDSKTKTHEAS